MGPLNTILNTRIMYSSRMHTNRFSVCLGGCLPPPSVDRQTPVKLLPCPELRLRAVITINLNSICVGIEIGIGQCKHTATTEQINIVTYRTMRIKTFTTETTAPILVQMSSEFVDVVVGSVTISALNLTGLLATINYNVSVSSRAAMNGEVRGGIIRQMNRCVHSE